MKMVLLGETMVRNVTNSGNIIKLNGYYGYIEVGHGDSKRTFDSKWIEFHVPAEHLLDGVQHPLEMQVVMQVKDRYIERDMANLAVLSVFYKAGIESYFFNALETWDLPEIGGLHYLANDSSINVRDEVWATDAYYYYEGTSTNPDLECLDKVYWYVIKDIKEASDWQINTFYDRLPKNNSRTLQDSSFDIYYSASMVLTLAWLLLS
jgi:carbonic anhydrase